MRIRTMTGLAVAGAAAVTAVAGGAAYAETRADPEPVVQIVTEREPADRDCPRGTATTVPVPQEAW
ncbi:hypothetical protein [Micromonospora fluostatini]|uniref:hypothetical protein n=1 Tax=Micromonospora sp. JCM 30529 TaxID=3421643 RepID=UPI003D16DB91